MNTSILFKVLFSLLLLCCYAIEIDLALFDLPVYGQDGTRCESSSNCPITCQCQQFLEGKWCHNNDLWKPEISSCAFKCANDSECPENSKCMQLGETKICEDCYNSAATKSISACKNVQPIVNTTPVPEVTPIVCSDDSDCGGDCECNEDLKLGCVSNSTWTAEIVTCLESKCFADSQCGAVACKPDPSGSGIGVCEDCFNFVFKKSQESCTGPSSEEEEPEPTLAF